MRLLGPGIAECLERIAVALEALLELQRGKLGLAGGEASEEEDFSWLGYTNEEEDALREEAEEARKKLGVKGD